MQNASKYWAAAQNYRAAANPEEKHNARVALLGIALCDSPAGRSAAAILRKDGLIIIRSTANVRAL